MLKNLKTRVKEIDPIDAALTTVCVVSAIVVVIIAAKDPKSYDGTDGNAEFVATPVQLINLASQGGAIRYDTDHGSYRLTRITEN